MREKPCARALPQTRARPTLARPTTTLTALRPSPSMCLNNACNPPPDRLFTSVEKPAGDAGRGPVRKTVATLQFCELGGGKMFSDGAEIFVVTHCTY